MNQKGFANIVLIVLVVILAGALGYVTLVRKPAPAEQPQTNNSQNTQPTTPPPTTNNPPPQTPPSNANTNLKTYTNSSYHYQVGYPSAEYDLKVSNGDRVVMFINKRFPGDIPDASIEIRSNYGEPIVFPNLSPKENAKRVISSWTIPSSTRDELIRNITLLKFAGRDTAMFKYDYIYRIFIDGENVFMVKTFVASSPEFQRDYSFIDTLKLLP